MRRRSFSHLVRICRGRECGFAATVLVTLLIAALPADGQTARQGATNGSDPGGLRSDEALTAQLAGRQDRAVELFRQRLETTRDEAAKAEALFGLGQSLLADGQNAEAAVHLLRFVDEYPKHRLADDALMGAADACRLAGEGRRADELYGRLRSDYGESPLAGAALLHQGQLAEETGEFEVALSLYGLLLKGDDSPLADEAEARRRFISENRDADFVALRAFRLAEARSRNPQQWTEAFVALVRLANSYRDQPIGDDALLLLTRLHLAQGDRGAAEQSFRRLLEASPSTLSRSEARGVALSAAGWLLTDAAAAIAGSRRVFAELSGYDSAGVLKAPRETGGPWQLAFTSPAGASGGSGSRYLKLRISYGRARPGQKADYANLGLIRMVQIETPNPLLREEIDRIIAQIDQTLAVLDRSAADRPPAE